MSRPTCLTAAGLALVCVALTAAGCSDGGALASPPASTTAATRSTPTSSPPSATPTLSERDAAVEAARKLVPVYFEVKDKARRNTTTTDPEEFKKVAISSGLTDLQNLLSAMREQNLRQTGATTVVSMDNPRVDLALNLKKTPPDVPTVQLDVCYDVSKVNIVDKDGKSTVPADRVPRGIMLIGVSNYQYPAVDQWRVAYTKLQEGKRC